MTPAQRLTDNLHGRWHQTYGKARCPAHDDRSPSLSIRDGEEAPLLKCHRGCDRLEIIAALRRLLRRYRRDLDPTAHRTRRTS